MPNCHAATTQIRELTAITRVANQQETAPSNRNDRKTDASLPTPFEPIAGRQSMQQQCVQRLLSSVQKIRGPQAPWLHVCMANRKRLEVSGSSSLSHTQSQNCMHASGSRSFTSLSHDQAWQQLFDMRKLLVTIVLPKCMFKTQVTT